MDIFSIFDNTIYGKTIWQSPQKNIQRTSLFWKMIQFSGGLETFEIVTQAIQKVVNCDINKIFWLFLFFCTFFLSWIHDSFMDTFEIKIETILEKMNKNSKAIFSFSACVLGLLAEKYKLILTFLTPYCYTYKASYVSYKKNVHN